MIMEMIAKLERERALNKMLLERLIEGLDEDVKRIEEKKDALREEFAERDASLLRLIEGEPPRPVSMPAPLEADAA
jgi:hypothetical protein